jgi:hypothetical protein
MAGEDAHYHSDPTQQRADLVINGCGPAFEPKHA